jgi:hypothetical protein
MVNGGTCFAILLFENVPRGQDLLWVHAHDEIDDLIRRDVGPPMRRVRRNDDDIAGTERRARAADDAPAAGARVR